MLAVTEFTDPTHMQAVFQAQLPGFAHGCLEITRCTVLHAFHKTYLRNWPGEKAVLAVAYRLEIHDPISGVDAPQIVYARAYQGERSRPAFYASLQRRLERPRWGTALAHLADLDMLVWGFPNDPALPQLPDVVDPARVRRHLPYAQLPSALSGPHDIGHMALTVVNYRPETRCTVRYDLHWGAPEQTLTLWGKTFADERGAGIYSRMAALWQRWDTTHAGFRVARPLAYDAATRTLWQAGLPGTSLLPRLDTSAPATWSAAIARGLAEIHAGDVTGLVRITAADQVAEAHKKAARLARAFPEHAAALDAILGSLGEHAAAVADAPERMIHGDFHIGQLLAQDGALACVDFDELALGDPLQDLANFVVDLHGQGLAPALVAALSAELIAEYRAAVPWAVPQARLDWHLRMQWLTRAYRTLVQHKPAPAATVGDAIAAAGRGLDAERVS